MEITYESNTSPNHPGWEEGIECDTTIIVFSIDGIRDTIDQEQCHQEIIYLGCGQEFTLIEDKDSDSEVLFVYYDSLVISDPVEDTFITLHECGESYSYTETHSSYLGCDSIVHTQVIGYPISESTDTLLHLTDHITIDTLTNEYGCDSIVTIVWIATDFEEDQEYEIVEIETETEETPPAEEVELQVDIPIEEEPEPVADLYLPNAFTPNGDGINDTWHPFPIDKKIQFTIYDRWGTELFQGTSWDGSFRNFKVQGIVAYRLEYEGEVLSGTISIL